jgi:hypothetical protein
LFINPLRSFKYNCAGHDIEEEEEEEDDEEDEEVEEEEGKRRGKWRRDQEGREDGK